MKTSGKVIVECSEDCDLCDIGCDKDCKYLGYDEDKEYLDNGEKNPCYDCCHNYHWSRQNNYIKDVQTIAFSKEFFKEVKTNDEG